MVKPEWVTGVGISLSAVPHRMSKTKKDKTPKVKKGKAAGKPKAKEVKEPEPKVEPVPTPEAPHTAAKFIADAQVEKAIAELVRFAERQEKPVPEKTQLFEEEETDENDVMVEIRSRRWLLKKPQFKPKTIKLEHPIYSSDTRTCFFVRDRVIDTEEQLEAVENANIPTLAKILTLNQLKTIYSPYDKREELYNEYDLFILDDAILNLMPLVLGKTFYNNNVTKFPIQIRTSTREAPRELSLELVRENFERVLGSTAYLPPTDFTFPVKIGTLKNTREELLANLAAVVATFDEAALVSVGLKTRLSPVLPLWFAEKIYTEEDIGDEEEAEEADEAVLAQGLLELADEAAVAEALAPQHKRMRL